MIKRPSGPTDTKGNKHKRDATKKKPSEDRRFDEEKKSSEDTEFEFEKEDKVGEKAPRDSDSTLLTLAADLDALACRMLNDLFSLIKGNDKWGNLDAARGKDFQDLRKGAKKEEIHDELKVKRRSTYQRKYGGRRE